MKKTPGRQLVDLIDEYSPVVRMSPLGKVLPALRDFIQQVEREREEARERDALLAMLVDRAGLGITSGERKELAEIIGQRSES